MLGLERLNAKTGCLISEKPSCFPNNPDYVPSIKLLARKVTLIGMKDCRRGGKGSLNLLSVRGILKMTRMIRQHSFNNQMIWILKNLAFMLRPYLIPSCSAPRAYGIKRKATAYRRKPEESI